MSEVKVSIEAMEANLNKKLEFCLALEKEKDNQIIMLRERERLLQLQVSRVSHESYKAMSDVREVREELRRLNRRKNREIWLKRGDQSNVCVKCLYKFPGEVDQFTSEPPVCLDCDPSNSYEGCYGL